MRHAYIDMLSALQVPKRLYTLEELRLNDVRPEEFLSPEDSTLNTVRTVLQVKLNQAAVFSFQCSLHDGSETVCMQAAGLAGVTAAYFAFHLSTSQALAIVAAVMFVVVGDQVSLLP